MVLYPLNAPADVSRKDVIPAWNAIERTQKQAASEWWLIAQPDHAALSGDLASRISFPDFPQLDAHVLQAIALHDEGWARFDGGSALKLNGQGRPVSFLETSPPDFVIAWRGSIERSEQIAAIGGILVSEHFCRIARARLQSGADTADDKRIIRDFLQGEAERQTQLSRGLRRSAAEISLLVEVLQFCDLFFLSRRRHTRLQGDWSSDVCSSDLVCRREQSTDTVAALASAAAEHLVTKSAFSGSLMEWHRHRTLHSHDQRYRQRGRLSERALQSSHSRTNHLEEFGTSTD